jgi:hypothetical protein
MSHLDIHTQAVHLKTRLYSCPIEGCGQTFAYPHHCKRHVKHRHGKEPSSFQKTLKALSLSYPTTIHNNDDKEPYVDIKDASPIDKDQNNYSQTQQEEFSSNDNHGRRSLSPSSHPKEPLKLHKGMLKLIVYIHEIRQD